MASLRKSIRLIPRYNWDYGFRDLCGSLAGSLSYDGENRTYADGIFGPSPVFTFFTASGRVSLFTILSALRLPPGSGIGVPLFCCPVVFDAIVQAGHRPVFIDIDKDTYCISPEDIDKKQKALSAVVAVHMFGHPADMDAIQAASGTVPVIEDCAQGLFSAYKGRSTGSLGTVSFFSFRSGKYLSAGEGSAIRCTDGALAEAIAKAIGSYPSWHFAATVGHCLATYVKSTFYHRPWYGLIGYPLGRRLDAKLNLSAKNGFEKKKISAGDLYTVIRRLPDFHEKIARQRAIAHFYLKTITAKGIVLPHEKESCTSNYFQFAIRAKTECLRDGLAAFLLDRGIDTAKYLSDVVDEARKLYGYEGGCPVTEQCVKTVLSVPNYYTLTDKDTAYIADRINDYKG